MKNMVTRCVRCNKFVGPSEARGWGKLGQDTLCAECYRYKSHLAGWIMLALLAACIFTLLFRLFG